MSFHYYYLFTDNYLFIIDCPLLIIVGPQSIFTLIIINLYYIYIKYFSIQTTLYFSFQFFIFLLASFYYYLALLDYLYCNFQTIIYIFPLHLTLVIQCLYHYFINNFFIKFFHSLFYHLRIVHLYNRHQFYFDYYFYHFIYSYSLFIIFITFYYQIFDIHYQYKAVPYFYC